MERGDKVKVKNYQDTESTMVYTVLDFDDETVKLKHPDIAGYFIFSKDVVLEVVDANR